MKRIKRELPSQLRVGETIYLFDISRKATRIGTFTGLQFSRVGTYLLGHFCDNSADDRDATPHDFCICMSAKEPMHSEIDGWYLESLVPDDEVEPETHPASPSPASGVFSPNPQGGDGGPGGPSWDRSYGESSTAVSYGVVVDGVLVFKRTMEEAAALAEEQSRRDQAHDLVYLLKAVGVVTPTGVFFTEGYK